MTVTRINFFRILPEPKYARERPKRLSRKPPTCLRPKKEISPALPAKMATIHVAYPGLLLLNLSVAAFGFSIAAIRSCDVYENKFGGEINIFCGERRTDDDDTVATTAILAAVFAAVAVLFGLFLSGKNGRVFVRPAFGMWVFHLLAGSLLLFSKARLRAAACEGKENNCGWPGADVAWFTSAVALHFSIVVLLLCFARGDLEREQGNEEENNEVLETSPAHRV